MTVKGRNKPRYGTPPMAQTGRAVQRPMTGLGIPLRQAEVADTFRAWTACASLDCVTLVSVSLRAIAF